MKSDSLSAALIIGLLCLTPAAWAGRVVANGKVEIGESETGRFIVVLKDAPLATYQGGLPGLAATSILATGAKKLNVTGASSRAYQAYLVGKQDDILKAAAAAIGRAPTVDYRYSVVLNGFAARINRNEAKRIARLPGVAFVKPERLYQLLTEAGPEWIGADAVWAGTPGYPAARGEGVIVGIIDTGINPLNPSFINPGPLNQYDYTNPIGNFVGVCDPNNPNYDPGFPCNNKLIGAWDFTPRVPGNPAGPLETNGQERYSRGGGLEDQLSL